MVLRNSTECGRSLPSGLLRRRTSISLLLRPTGRMQHGSITMYGTATLHHPNGRHLPGFPTWMWRNTEVRDFIDWLHEHNKALPYYDRTGFYGLDLYSLYNSARAVVDYLEEVDPDLAIVARRRYGCLSPWEADPAAYGHAALTGAYRNCEQDVVRMLAELHKKHLEYAYHDGERFLDAAQNAQLVADAERYYRVMYYGSRASWNLRDSHMFDTLLNVMTFHGESAKAVVWAHNSHVGDASATEMSARGEHNIGQLCRKKFGEESYSIGFGTDHGTVAAASNWDGPMEVMQVRPSHPQSYERLFHLTNKSGTHSSSACRTERRPLYSVEQAKAGAGHWRHLPTRDGACQPLFRGSSAPSV